MEMDNDLNRPADPEGATSFEGIERPPLRPIDKFCRASCMLKRYTIAIMAFLGFMIAYGTNCNMPAALSALQGPDFFDWVMLTTGDGRVRFWGFLISQIPGGIIATKYPASKIFGLSIVSSTALNLLVPLVMTFSLRAYLLKLRLLQGIIEGASFSACLGIWRFWAPPMERSRLATLPFSGSFAGILLGLPLSVILAEIFGFQTPFYVYGVLGVVWYLFWLWLSFEQPRDHPAISISELNHIEKSLGAESSDRSMNDTIPWRQILTSMPVYAIIVSSFCCNWSFYLLAFYQSAFLKYKFALRTEEMKLMNVMPFLIFMVIMPLGGVLADLLRSKKILSTTSVRKIFVCCGFGLEGICFLLVTHATTAIGALIALTCGVAFRGLAASGYNVNCLDIAPRYASLITGLSNGIGMLSWPWTFIFILAAAVHLNGVIIYGVYGSGELQSWAKPSTGQGQVNNQRPEYNQLTELNSPCNE